MGTGSAFGKTIFIGDQFVLRGVPAVLAALPFSTTARVEPTAGPGWSLADERIEVPGYKEQKKAQQVESIDHILEVMGIDARATPIHITYGGDLLAGSGVGASAASCVSLARALDDEFGLGLSVEEINRIGWEGEFAYHGRPSGVDNTASTYGGVLCYRVDGDHKSFEHIPLKRPVEGVLAASGVTADTAKLDGFLDALEAEDPALFAQRLEAIREQVFALKAALETDDLETVGAIMTANHAILIDMGLSHHVLIELCDMALAAGALGAKVTGGGRGGYAFALTPGRELQEAVASTIEAAGYQVIRATYGAV